MASVRVNRLQAWFERMSDRERNLVLGGGAVIVLVGVLLVGVLVSRRVSALDEQVGFNDAALHDIAGLGPGWLQRKADEGAARSQLDRAAKESLQATLLNIAKLVAVDKRDSEGNTASTKLSDEIKFANVQDILAELTAKTKGKKKKPKKGERPVFLSSIDCVFQNVPDESILRFMALVEGHEDPMFGISLDINRTGPTRDQIQATLKVGQFRYGQLEEGE
ncbi:MAG: hypothetical protein EXR79_14925 [Myxococcales bacterium]|nr:hypothetical protein [Myxococcales bacterium]